MQIIFTPTPETYGGKAAEASDPPRKGAGDLFYKAHLFADIFQDMNRDKHGKQEAKKLQCSRPQICR